MTTSAETTRATQQTTIRQAFAVTGVGLHSASSVQARVIPAPAYTGYVFRRTDLNNFEIPAAPENVAHVSYATTLMKSGVMISTVEHLLSALVGCGVDNAIIEVDSLEIPILDGSSAEWTRLIAEAGIVTLPAPRRYLQVLKHIAVAEKNRTMSIEPADRFRITCEIDFPNSVIGTQHYAVTFEHGNYQTQIAPARTFGFVEEIETLRQNGLARGASLENAVAVTKEGVLNPEGLRFANEFVRHKILDIIGDLALCGLPILGHVKAARSGHGLHTMLLATLLRDRSAWQMVS